MLYFLAGILLRRFALLNQKTTEKKPRKANERALDLAQYAGSGESEIRRHVLENDWLETIVALPTELFYNTGIATYIWLIRNNKPTNRKGKIQLINAVDFWRPMKRSLGNKRRRIHNGIEGSGENERYVKANDQIKQIIDIHKAFKPGPQSKIFELEDFAFRKVFLDLEETDADGYPMTIEKEVTVAQNKLTETLLIKTADEKKSWRF